MRQFIKNIVKLVDAGELRITSCGFMDSDIPNGYPTLSSYWKIKTVRSNSMMAFVIRSHMGLGSGTLVDNNTRTKTKLSYREYWALSRAAGGVNSGPSLLVEDLDRMVKDLDDRVMREGKQLIEMENARKQRELDNRRIRD